MKAAKTLILALALAPAIGRAQTAAQDIAQGRAYLAAHDILNANKEFAAAVALAPNNPDANVFLAATRLLSLANQPAGVAFLDKLGFSATNRSIYAWTATVPTDTNGVPFAPPGVSAAYIPSFLRTNCLPQIVAAEANLAVVSNTNYTLILSNSETTTAQVTLDYGDLLLLRAGLKAAQYACYTVCAWNFDAQFTELRSIWTNSATAQELLRLHPSLFTFTTTDDLQAARQAFTSAVTLYTNASAFIRNRPLTVVRLFNYDPTRVESNGAESEANFRTTLLDLNRSLNGPVVVTLAPNLTADLGNQFTPALYPRKFLPELFGNAIVAGTLPDPTFGGIVQGLASYQVEDFIGNAGHLPFVSRLAIPRRAAGGQWQVSVNGLGEAFYAIQVSTNLLDWSDLTYGEVHQGLLSFSDAAAGAGARRFYRVLDESQTVSLDLTVIDAQTGNLVPGAMVILSVWRWQWSDNTWISVSDGGVTNLTDSAGHVVEVVQPMGDWEYSVTVAAPGYAAWTFDGYLPDDQHRTLSACLAPPGYAPPNDDFPGPTLTGTNITVTGSNVGATTQPDEPYLGTGQTVWWTWTAPLDGAVTVDTSGSSFNTVLGICTRIPR